MVQALITFVWSNTTANENGDPQSNSLSFEDTTFIAISGHDVELLERIDGTFYIRFEHLAYSNNWVIFRVVNGRQVVPSGGFGAGEVGMIVEYHSHYTDTDYNDSSWYQGLRLSRVFGQAVHDDWNTSVGKFAPEVGYFCNRLDVDGKFAQSSLIYRTALTGNLPDETYPSKC